MKRSSLAAITTWITAAARESGPQLPARVMDRLGIGRRAALALLRRLEAAQWLVAEGPPRQRSWRPGALRQVVQHYALDGLQEDRPWSLDFAPHFALPAEVARMARHAFTELVNNAIDHSGGSQVTVSMRQTPLQLQLLVSDDGCGLFDRIQSAHAIDDPQLALFELSKGKLTSQPDRHRGHGLFFCAQLADVFDLHANAQAFQYRGLDQRRWHPGRPLPRQGTSVYLAIALDTPRTLDGVLRAHSLDGDGYGFDRTVVPLRLLADGDGGALESRALARRVAARLHRFRRAELDFSGITDIGHGFADELFRVAPAAQPGLQMVPVGTSPRVAAMIEAARAD